MNSSLRLKSEKLAALMRDLRRLSDVSAGAHPFELCLPENWPEEPGRLRWSWADAAGARQQGQAEALESLPPEARDRPLVVWTPGTDTLLTTAALPTRSRAKILQALPFALEDQLLGEPESMEFGYRVLEDGRLAVAVTARARIDAWLGTFQAAGLRPVALCPAMLGLPLGEGAWSAAFRDGVLVVRTGSFSGFECLIADRQPPAMLVTALREAVAAEHAPRQLDVFDAPGDFDPAAWSEVLGLTVLASGQASPPAGMPPLNLLKGNVAGTGQMHPAVRRLRPAAIMFGIWVVAGFGFNLFEWWQLSSAAKAQREEMTTLFRKAFPEAKVVVDPALQMQRNLADLQVRGGSGSPGDLLPLLGQIAPVLQASRAIELQGLQYAEQAATIDLHLPDFQAIEALTSALNAKGLQVSVVNSNSRGTGVDSRLRVSVRKS